VTFSITAAACSQAVSSIGAPPSSAATAEPTNTANTTICRISLRAMASKIDEGTIWPMNSLSEKPGGVSPCSAAVVGGGSARPAPGWSSCTMTRPMVSDTSEAITNQPSVLTPTRPIAAESSIWAMPTTRVEKTRGAMIILISRRKTSVMIDRLPAAALAAAADRWVLSRKPVRTPRIIAPTIRAGRKRFNGKPRLLAKDMTASGRGRVHGWRDPRNFPSAAAPVTAVLAAPRYKRRHPRLVPGMTIGGEGRRQTCLAGPAYCIGPIP
jgi:hypothetical protein